ncbi:MAG: rane protein, partial [Mycobacterium sp.]|nr:rane protein [Mycobacterium sp.]
MGRLFKLLIPLVLIAFGLLWPVVFGATPSGGGDGAADPVVISDYTAHYTVDADGDLDAVETITGEFPVGRHGIFRHWDVTNQNSPKVRQVPQIQSILWDGEPAPYQLLWEGRERFRVAKIGSPDSTLDPGSHVFEIRYTIPGVLDPGIVGAGKQFGDSTGAVDAPTVFFWNVIAPAWNNEIDNVDITVTLPEPVLGAQCSVGFGRGAACSDLTVDGNTVRLAAQGLPPHTPVTLRAGVDMPTPPRAELPWTYHWDRVLGQSTTQVAVLVLLTLLGAATAILWARSTLERPPGFPIQYAPPPGLGPVQTEYIRTETVPESGLTATLFHLAERKLIELRQLDKHAWNVTGTAQPGAWADIDPVGVAVGSALKVIGPGAEFKARKSATSGEKLKRAKIDMAGAVRRWATDEGLIVKRRKELWLRAANAVAAILMVCGFFR